MNDQTDSLELEDLLAQVRYLEQQLSETNSELRETSARLEQVEAELLIVKVQANRAKDISPVDRPSLKRVMAIASNACMNLKKVVGGWLLFMGKLQRKFKSLKKIWILLTQEEWHLEDIFPSQEPAPKFKNAPPRFPKRYPDIAKQIFDWQTYVPPPPADEVPEYWVNHPRVEDDMPFAWSTG